VAVDLVLPVDGTETYHHPRIGVGVTDVPLIAKNAVFDVYVVGATEGGGRGPRIGRSSDKDQFRGAAVGRYIATVNHAAVDPRIDVREIAGAIPPGISYVGNPEPAGKNRVICRVRVRFDRKCRHGIHVAAIDLHVLENRCTPQIDHSVGIFSAAIIQSDDGAGPLPGHRDRGGNENAPGVAPAAVAPRGAASGQHDDVSRSRQIIDGVFKIILRATRTVDGLGLDGGQTENNYQSCVFDHRTTREVSHYIGAKRSTEGEASGLTKPRSSFERWS